MPRLFMQFLIFILFLVFFHTTCLGAPIQADSPPGAKLTLKIATLAPKGMGPKKRSDKDLYPELESACGNLIEIKVYWGGVMGDDEDYLKKMHIGQLHGAVLSSQGSIQACPEFSVVELPFLFNSYDEVNYVRDRMLGTFEGLFKKRGFKLALWIDQDFDPIYTMDFPIASLEDFKKARFGTAHGKIEELTLKTLGADTMHLEVPEAPVAIKSGMVNAGIAPTLFILGSQLYTVSKYVTPINIRYSPAVTVLSQPVWDSLPENCRKNLDAQSKKRADLINKRLQESNRKYLKAIIAYGVNKVEMTPENYQRIKEKALTVYEKLAGDIYPPELLEEINGHLKNYRATHPSPGPDTVVEPDLQ